MEIKHLHSFRAVAEELSFINASRKLHISQPALSAQIQALETELGVQLFARNRRSVRLTKPGEAFLRSAEAILQMADEAKADAQRASRPSLCREGSAVRAENQPRRSCEPLLSRKATAESATQNAHLFTMTSCTGAFQLGFLLSFVHAQPVLSSIRLKIGVYEHILAPTQGLP
jgi:DNA-binding transcriptional LysR family regulator